MQRSLDLWPIGNCQVSALVDRAGTIVWGCVPRVDGEPVFSALLDTADPQSPTATGFWSITLENCVSLEQHYIRNTPVLVSRHTDANGGTIEVVDFCPRLRRDNRGYRPAAFARVLRPLSGAPRIRVRLRPAAWLASDSRKTFGSHHIHYPLKRTDMRLTTNASASLVDEERLFRVEQPLHFFFGPNEPFLGDIGPTMEHMLTETISEWQLWVRSLAIPLEWQEAVIRAAITLKLCQHEETGAIVAALTTSIPEHDGSQRNWDYRYCWIRDAYYTVQALNRLGALDVLESYLGYLRNIVDASHGGAIQPLYGVLGEKELEERELATVAGYRGQGPVRIGNQAYQQVQHDVYGQIVLSSVHAFFDRRLLRLSGREDFESLEKVGEHAWKLHDVADAGLWELRTRQNVHTYSAAMCWAACDRLSKAATVLGLVNRAAFWSGRAATIRAEIEAKAWKPEANTMSARFEDVHMDASLIQLLDLHFFAPDDPRFLGTLAAVEKGLRRGNYMLRYATEDDFGVPMTAFTVCSFWLIEALYLTGRTEDARQLFEEMLSRRTSAGLLSEDMDFATGELWGNYPQTYSLVGIINCAALLSRPWRTVR
ncbi:MAG: glycoside hydrolase family 15 protein [Alphaproteobacteria bacterium]|nr:glycoside hydrolase family 15 protein [Alphaproteobacteria bacterium]